MLTERMQIQAIADRMANLPIDNYIHSEAFTEPWKTCWVAIEEAEPHQENHSLAMALAAFSDRDHLIQTILGTHPGHKPIFPTLYDIAHELTPLEWLWPGWIPRGLLTVFGAAQGSGKSFVGLDLAYRIIENKGFPNGSPIPIPGANVLYIDAEAVPQILNERAKNLEMDRTKLYVMMLEGYDPIDFGDKRYRDKLVEMISFVQPELVILDSLSSIHSRGQNNVEDVRDLLSFLAQVTASFHIGMLLIHHIRKPSSGQGMLAFDLSMEDLSGSGHITAMARVVLGLHVVQTGPQFDPNGPRELKMLKTNLGPYEDPLGFEFAPLHPKGVFLNWLEDAPQQYTQPSKADNCADWLLGILEESDEPLSPKDIIEMAELENYSRSTVYRARQSLGDRIQNISGHKNPDTTWTLKDPDIDNAE